MSNAMKSAQPAQKHGSSSAKTEKTSTKSKAAAADEDEDEDEDEKKERVAYVGTRNADKRLTAVPTDFNPREHLPLKRPDFATEDLYLRFKSAQLRARGQQMLDRANKLDEQATQIQKFGDPAARAKVRKFQKLADTMKELKATLEKEGISLADLGLE